MHPSVAEFYANLEENMVRGTTVPGSGFGPRHEPTTHRRYDSVIGPVRYEPHKDDLLILMYDGNLRGTLPHVRGDPKGYFLTVFRNGELLDLGSSWRDAKEEVRRAYKDMGINASDTADAALDNQLRYLEAFDILAGDKIHEVPLEIASRRISGQEMKNTRDYYKMIHNQEQQRRRMSLRPPPKDRLRATF